MLKSILVFFVAALILAACESPAPKAPVADRLTDFVDPFIGTGDHGHTYPGAAFPFGQIQLSPDNGTQGWDWCSGYHYSDSIVAGFSHLHLSGTGIGDLADISFLPVSTDVTFKEGEKNGDFVNRYAGKYKHSHEVAKAGYYSVNLKNSGIKAEFTVTERAGLHRYSFPEGGQNNLVINLGFAINWDKPYKTSLKVADSTLVTGTRLSKGWAADQHVYFAVRFSTPIAKSMITNVGGEDRTVGLLNFKQKQVLAKVGVSSVSVENAIANLDSSGFGDVDHPFSDHWTDKCA